ncbi:hypothetical protein BOX15_Mlig028629g1 [Macrostomum lignano]|uniref:Uncharacterized protein n=1 Tax=Macrostomum lignano TaxID=282301 RepID=A0A267F7J2_9PLAT|nr:hypothetical protein BOX15_Mlig028629g1 [Macrostomum lignano]
MSRHESSYGDDELAEIEQPRLEDSRTSVMQLPPYDLLLMLPNCRALSDRTAVLSSTLMQESGPESDWPTASSIGLANSRDSGRLSDKLNNAKLSLGVTGSSSSSLASAAAVVDTPAAVVAATADDASDALIPSLSDEQCEGRPDLSENLSPASSPRLRIPASEEELPPPAAAADLDFSGASARQQPADPVQQPRQPAQRMLGLLQVCCLTLDVLSEGGLLCDDARRWLTPELLCDKLCDRLARPARPSAPHPASDTASSYASAASESSSESSAVDAAETAAGADSPNNRVRRWLKAAAASPPPVPPHAWPNYSI